MHDIDHIIVQLYESVSFEPYSQPDWDTLKGLFAEQAQLIKAGSGSELDHWFLDLKRFVSLSERHVSQSQLQHTGFKETETMRRTERYERIAHVFSSYEAVTADGRDQIIARGTNSIQLVHFLGKWRITSLLWDEQNP
ncbi:MAG: hypothetical protein KDC35_18220 [Acidobacteria bacterium]|nr:hypothetical protein [Acidobacteriota bacterium]